MKQQVVVIHGGTTFKNYSDYISFLKKREIRPYNLRPSMDWKDTLAEKLGRNFDVLSPQMPDKTNASYEEWKIWFERIIPFIDKGVIFVGHSLGGIFLAKYLSENSFPKIIKATILVAAPFDDEGSGKSLADFKLPSSLTKFAKQAGDIYLFQSRDDTDVLFGQIEKYKKALPSAKVTVFEDRGHFNQEAFPEIISLINKLGS